ncbi:hypothetical protein JQ629_07495 [Bradyrhizobium sp. AUGA SZCCT0222]|uniref:hypothetical protein n=1 Tax=Bradyrhizobium sp. AUGA SZCCT0222 TaxID=2807668 RepID=UPI001BA6EE4D|nr:hypothetical protein [Bradyrhizobium sp. AUGA SZCCT0222]MBR1267349.1 hypothetical protein [Bradyrhizobium sp. AUGA SZCCT0222]
MSVVQAGASPASGSPASFKRSACETMSSNAAIAASISRKLQQSTDTFVSWSNNSIHNGGSSPTGDESLNIRISCIPILTIEITLGTEALSGMPDSAMNACVTRNLPDVWPDFVHILQSLNGGIRHGVRRPTHLHPLAVKPGRYRSKNRATETGRLEAAIHI